MEHDAILSICICLLNIFMLINSYVTDKQLDKIKNRLDTIESFLGQK